MERITSLTVTTDHLMSWDDIYNELQGTARRLVREYDNSIDINLSSHRVHEDPFDDGVVDDSKKILSFKVHTILCRLGMTETEAHTAISEIHDADIVFVKKES